MQIAEMIRRRGQIVRRAADEMQGPLAREPIEPDVIAAQLLGLPGALGIRCAEIGTREARAVETVQTDLVRVE